MEQITSYEKMLMNPIRSDIVGSILSRENASKMNEIHTDMPHIAEGQIRYHLNRLMACDVLMSDADPASKSLLKPAVVYFISYQDDRLQEVLKKKFPQYFE